MTVMPHSFDADDPVAPPIGLIALQTDETIEPEMQRYFRDHPSPIYVTRIPSGPEVTTEALAAMEAHLAASADLLPKARPYPVVAYGCTSASSIIGSDQVEALVRQRCDARVVTNPLRATVACAAAHGVSRLALLSPYIEEVNRPLREAFLRAGLTTDVFGTFAEAEEARVVRIATDSVVAAGVALGSDPAVDALFMSCTNLRTYAAIPRIAERIGKPVLSSNQALAWHVEQLLPAW